mgnify:CR=1 FL=1
MTRHHTLLWAELKDARRAFNLGALLAPHYQTCALPDAHGSALFVLDEQVDSDVVDGLVAAASDIAMDVPLLATWAAPGVEDAMRGMPVTLCRQLLTYGDIHTGVDQRTPPLMLASLAFNRDDWLEPADDLLPGVLTAAGAFPSGKEAFAARIRSSTRRYLRDRLRTAGQEMVR